MEEIKLIYKEAEGKRAGYTALLNLLINCREAIAEYYPPWEPPVSRLRATREFLP